MAHQIKIAFVDFSSLKTEMLESAASPFVPPHAKRKRGKSLERYHAHLAGRAALGYLLTAAKLDRFVIPNREFGYVTLCDRAGRLDPYRFVNISHTTGTAVAALSDFPVGIDLEHKTRDARRVLPRVATDSELAWSEAPSSEPLHENKPVLIWSAKEAFSKALGLGMRFGFKAFKIDFKQGPPYPASTTLQGPLKPQQPALRILEHRGFIISICSEIEALEEIPDLSTLNLG